jgi:glycosyltransferase involved in cell wall biosynthesis
MPGRFWKWRMHGAALTMARRTRALFDSGAAPDLVLATDMLDLATYLGLTRDLMQGRPSLLYMHENQLAYPEADPDPGWTASRQRRAARRDAHYPFSNLSACLAADIVCWNSAHNRDSFLAALPNFLGGFPDAQEPEALGSVAAKSQILPLGLDLASLDEARPEARRPGPPRIVWNHRWEHDKDPETFFDALFALRDEGLDFEIILLGESFVREPTAFAAAREALGDRILQYGHVPSRQAYASWLWQADIVVSTARHEFFGASVCEAIHCACRPVLPAALAYPELIPPQRQPQLLYGEGQFGEALRRAILEQSAAPPLQRDAPLRDCVAHLDWSRMAPRYDDLLEATAAAGRPARMLY